MPLPDIPITSWVQDQQERFRQLTESYFPSFEFEQAAKVEEGTIPHDFPLPGGEDQWNQAEQKRTEEQLRQQQQQDEAAQERRKQELIAQLQAEQQQAQQAADSQAMERGIATPDSFAADLQQGAAPIQTPTTAPTPDNTSTSGAFDLSPADQFKQFAGGLITSHFGPEPTPSPAPDQSPQPDNTSSSIWSGIGQVASNVGSAVTGAASRVGELASQVGESALEATGPARPYLEAAGRGLEEGYNDPRLQVSAAAVPRAISAVERAGQNVGAKAGEDVAAATGDPNEVVASPLGYNITRADVGRTIGSVLGDPLTYVGGLEAAALGRPALEIATRAIPGATEAAALGRGAVNLGRRALGAAAEEVMGLTPTLRAVEGEGNIFRGAARTGEEAAPAAAPDIDTAIEGIRSLRRSGLEEAAQEAERTLARESPLTFQEVRSRAREVIPEAAPVSSVPGNAASRGFTSLYHETDPEMALGLTHEIGHSTLRGMNVSPNPELALGQGGKGALIEFGHSEGVGLQKLRAKPGAQMMEATGQAAPEWAILEHDVAGRPGEMMKSITFAPDAQWNRLSTRLFGRLTRDEGWRVETTPDGRTRIINPDYRELGAGSTPEQAARVALRQNRMANPPDPQDVLSAAAQAREAAVEATPTAQQAMATSQAVRSRLRATPQEAAAARASAPTAPAGTAPTTPVTAPARGGAPPPAGTPPAPPRVPPPPSGAGVPPTPPTPPTVPTAASEYAKVDAAQQAVEAGAGRRVVPKNVQQVLGTMSSANYQLADRRGPIKDVEDFLEKMQGQPITPEQSAWVQARLYEGHSDASLAMTQREIFPTLSKLSPDERYQLPRYITMLDNADVAATRNAPDRVFSGGAKAIPEADVKDHFLQLLGPEKFNRMAGAADAFYKLRDELRVGAVHDQLWSQQTANTLMANFPHYAPTKILEHMSESAINNLPAGSPMFSVGANGIRKLTTAGTESLRQDPVRSLVDMTFRMNELRARNRVMLLIDRMADKPNMQDFVFRLNKIGGNKFEQPPAGYEAMSVFKNGIHQHIAVVSELVPALKLQDGPQNALMAAALNGMSAPLRAGATALRPAFIVKNGVNDAGLALFRFAASSRNPLEMINGFQHATDLYRGYRMAFGQSAPAVRALTGGFAGGGVEAVREDPNDPNYWLKIGAGAAIGAALGVGAFRHTGTDKELIQRMREAGGSIGMQTRFESHADVLRQLQGEHVWVRTIENPKGIMDLRKLGQVSDIAGMLWSRPLNAVGSQVELAPRYAAFARAARRGESDVVGAMAARRVTADFAAGGAFSKAVNRLVPFLNASTQATVEGIDIFRKNPVKASALMATIISGIIMTDAYNRSVAPDEYKDVTRFTKNTGMVVMSDQPAQGEGKRGLLYIPLRGIVGSLVPLTHAMLSAYYGDDPRTWHQIALDTGVATFNQMSPVNADVGGILRTTGLSPAQLTFELASNYNAFTGAPIISASQEGLPVSEQYTDRTSQAARALSRTNLPGVGGVSPLKIDYAVKGFSPGPGEALLGAADEAIRATGNELPSTARNVPLGARDVPVVGGIAGALLRTVGSERQNQAYNLADDIAARNRPHIVAMLEGNPAYQASTPDRQKQMLRSAEAALLDQAREMASVEDYKNPKDLGLPQRYYGVEPGSTLEGEIVTALDTPRQKRTAKQITLAAQYQHMENPQYRRAATQDRTENVKLRAAVGASMER